MAEELSRRPIKTRSKEWAKKLGSLLARSGLTPNQVSVTGIGFSILAGVWLVSSGYTAGVGKIILFFCAAACIQMRLLCNMLDGLMAVEGGLKSKTGEMFNELPDRIEDVVILVCAGYAVSDIQWGAELGWAAAVAAVATAYVRAFGGSLGLKQDFCGPMAKPHRMFVLTLGCLIAALEVVMQWEARALFGALLVIVAGSVVTVIRRTLRLARSLEAR